MVLSIPGKNGLTKTSSYRLVKQGSNDERESPSELSSSTKPSRWSSFLNLRLALLLLLLLSFLFNIFHLYTRHVPTPSSRSQFIPDVPYTSRPVIFHQDDHWVGASPATDALWNQHVENALLGYVRIPNPAAYALKPGVTYGMNGSEVFSISMYHQLHCLAMIRQAYYHPLEGQMHHGGGKGAAPSETAQRGAHMDHCFDYLRQGISCAADMTIEWAKVEYDGTRRQVDGWGISHWRCRDPEKVEEFVSKYRVE